MSGDSRFLLRIDAPERDRYVVIEDDGRVAYAYLFVGGRIVGDVWLYNVGDAPTAIDWKDRASMPFKNPAKYCKGVEMRRLGEKGVVRSEWTNVGVRIFVDDDEWARMEEGAKPGWSRNARVAGPLAKPLDDQESAS